ncbi:DUF2334 domain-containing protein [Clostridium uliginosum]|uniref:DUF2334 domain-containing protein n=1 Tax=Clostridium uliginosum TaxID=119641 RepID=A0A1I1HEA1_9CLOT|nr:DUF2334 domain-containing protein [Clostridium uliginosum]SFC19813.1 hypothetical protein SAMN05421842_101205 [Clostridium uliginosum]
MIYKNKLFDYKWIFVLEIFIIINSLFFVNVAYSDDNVAKVLILYDAYKEYGEEKNVLNDVNKLALATGKKVDIIRLESYEDEDLLSYDGIFIVCSKDDSLSQKVKKNLVRYNKKIFWLGKNFVNFVGEYKISEIEYKGLLDNLNEAKHNEESNDITKLITEIDNISYIRILEFDNYEYRHIYNAVYQSFRKEENSSNNIYFYIDEVTPFNDLNLLVEQINYLKKFGIPFFMKVTPVFENENLEAMGRFAEVLRYAQVNGGEIVLSFPALKSREIGGNIINKNIEESFENYINYWVYPIALDINEYYLYRDDLKILLENSNTLFLESNDEIGVLDFNRYVNGPYENIIQKVEFNGENNQSLEELYNNVAVTVSSKLSIDKFKSCVDYFINKDINFKSTYNINAHINYKNIDIKSNKKGILLSNKAVTQKRFINSEEYKNVINAEVKSYDKEITINLAKSNKIIVMITFIVAIIFIIIVSISIKIDRNKFFK